MLVIQILRWLLWIMEGIVALPILYVCTVSGSALLAQRKLAKRAEKEEAHATTQKTFAILIPAHNEEVILNTLLESLAELTYPKERYKVYVIADNCTDKTAELARQFEGVEVYERFNQERRGKGYALNWMWQQVAESQQGYDAYDVLDADSVVGPAVLPARS